MSVFWNPAARLTIGFVAATAMFTACTGADAQHGHTSAAPGSPGGGTTRTYFIAADEVEWDYAPAGRDVAKGHEFDTAENVFVAHSADRIGSTYLKCLYRAYTDSTFHTLVQRPADQASQGYLGPVIRAEVGDTIKVVFRNNCRFPVSMHPHGVQYDKDNEGAPYNDGAGPGHSADDSVATGQSITYTWHADESSGPGPMDGSSTVWMYHSHTDEIGDVYAGLSGFIIVTAKGRARPDASPRDVDREEFALFEVDDENQSPLLDANIAKYLTKPVDPDDEEFVESNLMHGINGYVYGNGPMFTMKQGEKVRWYLMGMGTEVDLHTPHWHANTVVINGMRTDVANLLPASMVVADMTADDAGIWLFHCHVGDHIAAGMVARYEVLAGS